MTNTIAPQRDANQKYNFTFVKMDVARLMKDDKCRAAHRGKELSQAVGRDVNWDKHC